MPLTQCVSTWSIMLGARWRPWNSSGLAVANKILSRHVVMSIVSVNSHVRFELAKKLGCLSPHPAPHHLIPSMFVSKYPLRPLVRGGAARSQLFDEWGKREAKQPENKNTMSWRAARKQTIPNRGYYCLSHDALGTRSSGAAMGCLSMERQLSWKLQPTASTSPADFYCMFEPPDLMVLPLFALHQAILIMSIACCEHLIW